MDKPKILNADDELGARALFKVIVGHIVTSDINLAESGGDALRILETLLPDLILLGDDMPNMSGYELIQEVRTILRLVNTTP